MHSQCTIQQVVGSNPVVVIAALMGKKLKSSFVLKRNIICKEKTDT